MESKTNVIEEKVESEYVENKDIKNKDVNIEPKQELEIITDIKIELKNECNENCMDTTKEYLKKDGEMVRDIKEYVSVKREISDGEQFYDEPQNKQIKVEQTSDTYEKHHYNTIKIKD